MGKPPTLSTRAIVVAQIVLIAGSVAAVAFLYTQMGPLLRQRDRLRGEIETAATDLKAKKDLLDRLEAQRRDLEAKNRQLEAKNQQLDADRMVLLKSLPAIASGEHAREAVEGAVSTVVGNTNVVTISPRVYIQVGARTDDPVAHDVTDALQQAGFIVPGIEHVARTPGRPQLRYFREEDVADARRAVAAIGDRISGLELTFVPLARGGRIRPRHLELWF